MRTQATHASLALVLLCAAEAHAASTVAWSAPSECGDGDGFRAALQRELGQRELPGPVRVEVRPRGNAYALRLELLERGGANQVVFERQLVAPTCFELRAAALSVLVVSATEQLDTSGEPAPDATLAPPAPPVEVHPREPAPAVGQPAPHPQNPAEPRDQRGLQRARWGIDEGLLGLGVGLEGGRVAATAPRLEAQLRLSVLSISLGKIGVAASALYVPKQRHDVDADRGGELSRTAARLGGMLQIEPGIEPLTLQFALQAELARVTGAGYGVTSPATRAVWRNALVADAELGVAIERLRVGLWGELSAARDDSRYVLEGVGEVYRPSIFALSGGLRAWLRFP